MTVTEIKLTVTKISAESGFGIFLRRGMGEAVLRFYAELNDFLQPEKRQKEFAFLFGSVSNPSTKDILKELNIPYDKVELVLVNGESKRLSYKVREGDRIAFYPVFEGFDISTELKIRKNPLRETKFVADAHLGKLAKYLRMLGFDTSVFSSGGDDELVFISKVENRILLTMDKKLSEREELTHVYLIQSKILDVQLREVIKRFDLYRCPSPFTRCLECNGEIIKISKNKILHQISSEILADYVGFWKCKNCDKVYWHGSHYEKMKKFVEKLLKENDNGGS